MEKKKPQKKEAHLRYVFHTYSPWLSGRPVKDRPVGRDIYAEHRIFIHLYSIKAKSVKPKIYFSEVSAFLKHFSHACSLSLGMVRRTKSMRFRDQLTFFLVPSSGQHF